jgi:DNA-binding CsgD family transcriptional regulator
VPALLERDAVLQRIEGALGAAADGAGRLLLIEGAAGLGKSTLLEAARSRAQQAGARGLLARGSELERDHAWGGALQLFGRALGNRDELPEPVRAVLETSGDVGSADSFAIMHGLFAVVDQLSEQGPVALLVDDAQWLDLPSLRFLAYMASRLDGVAASVIIASRTGETGDAAQLLEQITAGEAVSVRLDPLHTESVAEVVRRSLGAEAGDDTCDAIATLTGGNPFYLHELLLTLRRGDADIRSMSAQGLRELRPASVSRAVLARVARLPRGAIELAQAVAILGPGAELRHGAALAELEPDVAGSAADALTRAEILAPAEPLSFVHPLVAQAIAGDIPLHARAMRHLRAARLLAGEGADPDSVAAHLLHATSAGDQWTVEQLRDAARRARVRGGAESAVRYLERALSEPPSRDVRGDVLFELTSAEAAAGVQISPDRLEESLRWNGEAARRAEIHRIRGQALFVQGRHSDAAAAFDEGRRELSSSGDTRRVRELQAAYIAAASIDPELRPEALSRADALVAELEGPLSPGDRAILAQVALHHCLAGDPRPDVAALALRAWDNGALLADETAAGFNWTLVTGALDFSDELEHALSVCEAAMSDARRLGSPLAFATASYERAIPLYYMGRIAQASADAQAALDSTSYGWQMYARSAAYTLALCQLERDELDRAQETLSVLDHERPDSSIEHPALLDAHAILLRRQGRPEESLAEHLEAGRLFTEVFGVLTTGDVAWRLGAADSALAAGDRERALALAAEELEFSRSVQLTRGVIGALRVLGLAQGGEQGISLLEEAVAMGDPAPNRLEHIRALVDLGAALRRANRRVECREPLRRALEVAVAHGASGLATRARIELEATGARPRHVMLSGIESLTPSERRIAELAAGGATNREIAQLLFVSAKTVEYHLRHVFQKLDLSSRRQLRGMFARGDQAA